MSIRAKILSIIVSALLLAFVVSSLAYIHVTELDRDMEQILERQIPVAQAVTGVRVGVLRVGDAEKRMLAAGDVSHMRTVQVALTDVGVHVQRGLESPETEGQRERWTQISRLLSELRFQQQHLEGLINVEVRELQGLTRRLAPSLSDLRSQLVRLRTDLETDDAASDIDGARRRSAIEAAQQAERLLAELSRVRYSASQTEAYAQDLQRNVVTSRLAGVRRNVGLIAGSLRGTPRYAAVREVTTSLADAGRQLEEVERRILDVNQRLLSAREETQLTRDRMRKVASSIERDEWARIEASRARMVDKRITAGNMILFVLLAGVLFVGVLAFGVLRSLTVSIGRLLRASRRLRRGELDARVEIGGRDELQELGSSFNTMAQYLQQRRDRQNHYNRIVTKLNSSLGVTDTLEVSLSDVVVRTGSDLGAIYLHDLEADELELAHSYGISAKSAARKRIPIGEGIIGQVASSRRLVCVEPVPPGMFDLDLGLASGPPKTLLILPLVHLDALLGVILLGSARPIAPEQVTFIEEVAFQLAVALRNARFYQTIERTAKALRDANDKLKEEQAALERANDQMAEANRLKSEFLANVTHELRTPLNSIIGYTELVLDDERVDGGNRRSLDTTLRNARNLLRLINDLLDVSRMEAGVVTLNIERFDILRLMEDVLEMAQPLVSGKPVTVTSKLPDSLPWMRSDRMKCKQILVNLLSNAIKFTDTGSVGLSVEMEETMLAVHVRDSGIGIRPEDLDVVFEKFRQLDGSSSRRHGGTGLGLAITRQLCDFLGGEVSAASVVGEGSTFTVRLPMNLGGTADAMPTVQPGAEDEGWVEEGGRPFLLVMDDDPSSVVNLREVLDGTRLDVKSAFTAREAADILARLDPVGVVVGSTLPEEDGSTAMSDVWARIKDEGHPVVLVAGVGRFGAGDGGNPDEELTDTKLARVVGMLKRPLDASEVLHLLAQAGVEDLPQLANDGDTLGATDA